MAPPWDFRWFFMKAEEMGLTDAMLPFLLIFTIIFAILQKSNILGDKKKNLNVVVSLVIALITVIPHITGAYQRMGLIDVVDVMNRALPNVSIILVAIVSILLLIGLLGGEAKWMGGSISGWIALLSIILIAIIFGHAAGWWFFVDWAWLNDSETVAVVIILLVFGVLIWFITKDEDEGGSEGPGVLEQLGDLFKKS